MESLEQLIKAASQGPMLLKLLAQLGDQRNEIANLITKVLQELLAQPGMLILCGLASTVSETEVQAR